MKRFLTIAVVLISALGCVHVRSYAEIQQDCRSHMSTDADYRECMQASINEEQSKTAHNEEVRARTRAAISGFGQGMQQPVYQQPVNCTTQYVGQQAYTTCN